MMKNRRKWLAVLMAAGMMLGLPGVVQAADESVPEPAAGYSEKQDEVDYMVSLEDGKATVTNIHDGSMVTFDGVLHTSVNENGLLTLDIQAPSAYTSIAASLLIFPTGTDWFNQADARYALYEYDKETGKLGKATGEVITGKELEERGLRFGDSETEPGIGWQILPDTAGTLTLAGEYDVACSDTHVLTVGQDAGPYYFHLRVVNSADDTLIATIQQVKDVEEGQWLQYSNGKWGFRLSEEMEGTLLGWKQIGGKWYYFDYVSDGRNQMQVGWKKLNGDWNGWFYFDESGAMVTGWQKIGDSWYHLAASGRMDTGWLQDGENWYFLDQGGQMVTGWLLSGNNWYYLREDGAMATGWHQLGGSWYYLRENGTMATGWQELDDGWYYFADNGAMLADQVVDGYQLDASGRWITS